MGKENDMKNATATFFAAIFSTFAAVAQVVPDAAAAANRRLPVPPELDRAVLAYAAKNRPIRRAWNIAFILHHAAIPIAAAAMVCIGLVFAFHQPERKVQGNSLAQSGKTSFSYDWDTVDSEILLLSSQIQDASARLSRTEAYTGINE